MQSVEFEHTGDDEPTKRPAKRQRIARACVPCRGAKLRCDGQQPTCSTCMQLEKSCAYEAVAKRRGLRSGYVRALELLWGLTLQELENVEPVVDELLSWLSKEDLAATADRTDNNSAASAILDRWKQSDISRHLNDLLNEDEACTQASGTREVHRRSQDLRSLSEPSWTVVSKTTAERECIVSDLGNIPSQPNILSTDHYHVRQIDPVTQHKPPVYASQLLQLFFHHTQSWLPIVERHIVLRTSFQSQRTSSLAQHGNRAALQGVYAYVSATSSHLLADKQLGQHAEANSGTLYAQAYSMLPLDSDVPVELGHVQCALLLALARLASGAFKASWRLARIAVQLMQEMTSQNHDDCDKDSLGRAWLGSFVVDTITSACLKHRPSLHFNDVAHWCQIDENGVEEWQLWQPLNPSGHATRATRTLEVPTHSVSLLVLQVKLLRILNDSLHAQGPPGVVAKNDVEAWDQEFISYSLRTGLNSTLENTDVDTTALPPSFVSLGIIYTSLLEEIVKQHPGDYVSRERSYPQLSNVTLRKLKQDRNALNQLPTLHLLRRDAIDVIVTRHSEQSPVDDAANATNGAASQPGMDTQPHLEGFLTSSNAGTYSNQFEVPTQDPDSAGPSLDACMDGIDAPFLNFLDTLDDRSINDDLFNKSLGYSF